MGKHLVVVESPAKAKYSSRSTSGPGYEVMASYGHVRDLRPKEGAVEPDNGFAMHYEVIEKNERHVAAIAKRHEEGGRARSSPLTRIARARPSPGTLWSCLRERGILKREARPARGFPRDHEARRARSHRSIPASSPWSWWMLSRPAVRSTTWWDSTSLRCCGRKIRRGLSAGRVQSPALRMIAEREEEIERFAAA